MRDLTTGEADDRRRRALARARFASSLAWTAIAATLLLALATDQPPIDAIAWGQLSLFLVIAIAAERSAARRRRRVHATAQDVKPTDTGGAA